MAPATQPCACRRVLLKRLVHGPDLHALAQLPSGAIVTLAAQPPDTAGRRFVVAARLKRNCTSALAAAPRCRVRCGVHKKRVSFGIQTYKATKLLPYHSGPLRVRVGLVHARADAFASLATEADAWVNASDKCGGDSAVPLDLVEAVAGWELVLKVTSISQERLARGTGAAGASVDQIASDAFQAMSEMRTPRQGVNRRGSSSCGSVSGAKKMSTSQAARMSQTGERLSLLSQRAC